MAGWSRLLCYRWRCLPTHCMKVDYCRRQMLIFYQHMHCLWHYQIICSLHVCFQSCRLLCLTARIRTVDIWNIYYNDREEKNISETGFSGAEYPEELRQRCRARFYFCSFSVRHILPVESRTICIIHRTLNKWYGNPISEWEVEHWYCWWNWYLFFCLVYSGQNLPCCFQWWYVINILSLRLYLPFIWQHGWLFPKNIAFW